MNETALQKAIVKFYDYLSRERLYYLQLWEETEDAGMKIYYGEKASTYTSIKLYMVKVFKDLISARTHEENRKHGL